MKTMLFGKVTGLAFLERFLQWEKHPCAAVSGIKTAAFFRPTEHR